MYTFLLISLSRGLFILLLFGRKNTFLDVIAAEKNVSKQSILETLGDKAKALDNIRLCDLNEDNRKIYETALLDIKE